MTITDHIVKDVVTRVIKSQDYRSQVVGIINTEFLQFTIDFFKKVVDAKIRSEEISIEWYKKAFINNSELSSDEIAVHSGLNKKTIHNMYRSSTKQIVLDASNEHFDTLYENIRTLVENESDIDLTLTIKFNKVSVDLNVSESLIVINTLAVKRAALRGGMWSTVGKRVEKVLMMTLCKIYQVDQQYYDAEHFVKDKKKSVDREVDFYLQKDNKRYRCEVKLMGQGNPESADAIIARDSKIFVADTLSEQNKNQCNERGVYWVACRDKDGFRRFKLALEALNIPHSEYSGNLDNDLPKILDSLN